VSSAPPLILDLIPGKSPLVISLPHVGTGIPAEVAAVMSPRASELEDTDWHVDRLYGFARASGVSWLQARMSRYVIDLNRPPGDEALYPGQPSTGLCPALTFGGLPLYSGEPPDAAEIGRRRASYWAPYHAALVQLLAASQRRHGFAVLLDAHSIRGEVPRLFAGRLPDINVGTNDGRSCAPELASEVMARLGAQDRFSHVLNGRFKGGYITRAYGQPDRGVHALQIELAQRAYMDEAGHEFEAARAAPLGTVLQSVVDALLSFRPG
jgi:N-formylglutamate deformylase